MILALLSWWTGAAFISAPGEGSLGISITNIHPVEGELYVALYDCEEDYMKVEESAFRSMVKVEGPEQEVVFREVPEGEYAVAVFQDLNGNGKLDTRKMGIPKEPFGFSNNARGKTGPPKYKKASFRFSGDMQISIRMVNDKKKDKE